MAAGSWRQISLDRQLHPWRLFAQTAQPQIEVCGWTKGSLLAVGVSGAGSRHGHAKAFRETARKDLSSCMD